MCYTVWDVKTSFEQNPITTKFDYVNTMHRKFASVTKST